MSNLVLAKDNKLKVNSKDIADNFGKQHRQVLRDIRSLIEQAGGDLGEHNFVPSSYTSEQNKVLPCYEMDRDGFSLLAMGFTGKAALQWKLKYIKAFNEMERFLLEGGGSLMQSLNEAMQLMEQDKQVASACGGGLNEWKKIRKAHMAKIDKLHSDVQLLLNFKKEN